VDAGGIGVSEAAVAAYVALLRGGPNGPDETDAAVAELLRLGLASTTGGELRALPPRAVLDEVARRHEQQAQQARERAVVLSELWQQHNHGPSYLEHLTTTAATLTAQNRLMATAEERVLALSIGRVGDPGGPAEAAPGLEDALARGVDIRVVYGAEVLTRSDALRVAREAVAAGEQARVFPDVPINLLISEKFALLVIAGRGSERLNALIVHHSGLYDGLVGVFETYWRVGVPVTVAADDTVPAMTSTEHRQLLTLLSAGLTDESIARELGVSQRTVARRIAHVQQAVGASSRFQLGVQAARHGLL
jgi:DNA-binding NarL/FixJ family response regulator